MRVAAERGEKRTRRRRPPRVAARATRECAPLSGVAQTLLLCADDVAGQDANDPRGTQQDDDLTRAILDYLDEHPTAMDSLEGIAEWWVNRARVRQDVLAVARALAALTERGIVEEVGTGAERRYRRKRP